MQPDGKPVPSGSREGEEAQHRCEKKRYGVDDVAEQMSRSLRFYRETVLAAPDGRQKETRGLDAALGPALLLDLDRAHFGRQLAGYFDSGAEYEAPPGQLRPIAQIQVFGQRRGAPATCRLYALALPHARRAVRVEEQPRAEASLVLDPEVSVQ